MGFTPRSPRCSSVRRITDSTKKTWLMPVPANALASHSAPFIIPWSLMLFLFLPTLKSTRSRQLLRLAGRDRILAFEQQLGALDDRHVNHLAIDGDRADSLGERLVIGTDNTARVIDLSRARTEFFVQDRDLAWVDHAGAHEAEPARAADRLAKTVEVAE